MKPSKHAKPQLSPAWLDCYKLDEWKAVNQIREEIVSLSRPQQNDRIT